MTEGSSTGSHSRDAVAAAGVAVDPLPVCWSGAHPVSRGMIATNRPTTMAVKGSGMGAAFVTLIHRKNRSVADRLINDCSIPIEGTVRGVDFVRATSCVVWGK
jgi:hypothetical protein